MIRKFLLKLLVKWYIGRNRDINKLSVEQEYNKFLFKDNTAIEEILRAYLTRSTLMYWEASSEYERNLEKGGALMIRMLLDLHRAAIAASKEKVPERKVMLFTNLRNKLLGEQPTKKL